MSLSQELFQTLLIVAAAAALTLAVGVASWAWAQQVVAHRQRARDARTLSRQRELRAARGSRATLDNPIVTPAQDVLGRAQVAHEFAYDLRTIDPIQGLVVGVLGPWGSGKSSFINLMKEAFEKAPALTVVDFNPWMFSGTEHLATVFFKEIAAELRLHDPLRYAQIADAFDEYGEVLNPNSLDARLGWRHIGSGAVQKARRHWRATSAIPLKEDIADTLADLDSPIVVVIDDIDRLSTSEIRDMFKLVRLTASFPNVIYLLSFDRERVEAALSDGTVRGRLYLEKIIQLSFDLPTIPREALRAQVLERLDGLLEGLPESRFDRARWPDVYIELVEPLLKTMRDVVRFAISARPTLRALGDEIETVDLLALEAVRVFRPELFAQIPWSRTALTGLQGPFDSQVDPIGKVEIERLMELSSGDQELVRQLIRRLFPAARRYIDNQHFGSEFGPTWRAARRVADADILNLYLERTAPAGLVSLRRSEIANSLMTDEEALDAYLRGLDPTVLEETIAGLEMYESSFDEASVIPASIVLLNLIPHVPDRDPRGMFDITRRDIIVERVVLRLLRRIEDQRRRAHVIRQIWRRVDTYSGKLALTRLVNPVHEEKADLLVEQIAHDLEGRLARQVLRQRPRNPEQEWDLVRVVNFALDQKDDSRLERSIRSPAEIRSLFQSARSVSQSQSEGSRFVATEERLWWDGLVRAFGDEESLTVGARVLRQVDGDTPLTRLVEKYRSGWRPKDRWSPESS